MKKFWNSLFILLIAVSLSAAPRSYYDSGSVTDVNAQITFDFNPSGFCIKNTGATNELFYDFSDGVAVADTTDSSNIQLAANTEHCFNTGDPNVSNDFIIGVICSAAETTTYEVRGIHR